MKDSKTKWDFVSASRDALADTGLKAALDRATDRFDEGRRTAFMDLPDGDRLRDIAKQIKDECLSDLGTYLAEFADNFEEAGGVVHWADDAEQACEIITQIALDNDVKTIAKSKSMASEEIHLNDALEKADFDVVETDLGEYILQVTEDRPSHIVLPAVHRTKEDIAEAFSEVFEKKIPPVPEILAKEARIRLRGEFEKSDMGITGVNVACADTGTIVQVTNEGNGRLSTTWPKIHVALMGMEKLIARFEDVPVFLKLLARSATGQKSTVYTNIITGPKSPSETDGAEQCHIVILDNGRTETLKGELRDALMCIRCGACLNSCPVYRQVGGHAYGGVYPGPIGSLLTPIFEGKSKFKELPHASTLCGACLDACPVKIDIPSLLIKTKTLQIDEKITSWSERVAFRIWTLGLRWPWAYRLGANVFRRATSLFGKEGWVQRLPGPLSRWTGSRDFPVMDAKPFHKRWSERNP